MALGKDTQAKVAAVYPNSYHLMPRLEKACTIIKYDNGGYSRVEFSATGLNRRGQVIVKCFEIVMRLFGHKDDDEQQGN